MDIKEINEKRRVGDYEVAAKMLGISRENVRKHLNRPRARRHAAVVEAMGKVIANREALINESAKK